MRIAHFISVVLVAVMVLLAAGACTVRDPAIRPPLAVPASGPQKEKSHGEAAASQGDSATSEAARQSQAMADRLAGRGADDANDDATGSTSSQVTQEPVFDPFVNDPALPTERPPLQAQESNQQPPLENASGNDPSKVIWANPVTASATAGATTPPTPPLAAKPVAAKPAVAPKPVAAPLAPLPRSREELMAALVDQLAAESGGALPRAVVAAGLSLADPRDALAPRLIADLKPLEREAAGRVRDLFAKLRTVADDPNARFDRKTVDTAVAEAFGDQPVSIAHVDLCKTVAGYGVYEPLGTDRFLAGQVNRMILYVEVEDFVPLKLDDEQREVRLSQELILYKEHDGLAVWQDGPTEIVDVSRNHRRDFFLVHMIELPARLGPGRYRLKIRVTDPHGDTVDETTLRLLMVADRALLEGP